ncbi:hypothetical protein BaRGS_00018413 [Batillaria attramentaria]|uniref:Uncharacterized protein n=1 Tax=Batillaria attramentaria TaxID=370345 RepID=A0ABD0KU65_9CAEN
MALLSGTLGRHIDTILTGLRYVGRGEQHIDTILAGLRHSFSPNTMCHGFAKWDRGREARHIDTIQAGLRYSFHPNNGFAIED